MLHTKLFTSLLLIRAKYWKQVYPKLCIKIRMVKKNNRIWKCITGEVAVRSRSYLSFPGMSNDWEKCEEKQESYSFGQNGMDFSSGSQAFLDFYYKKAEWRSASLASLWSWTGLYCWLKEEPGSAQQLCSGVRYVSETVLTSPATPLWVLVCPSVEWK